MKRLSLLAFAVLLASGAFARSIGFGLDAFNRVVPASSVRAAAFSPLSFEFDSLVFAEAVDPIRRAIFANALGITDEFEAEYVPLSRAAFEIGSTNLFRLSWAHALVVNEPRRVESAYRLGLQTTYGVEVVSAKFPRGVEAWVKTHFEGAFDGWRLPPPPPKGDNYSLHDLVFVDAVQAPSNGVKRVLPTHTVYRAPLLDGRNFYAIVPKEDRPVSSVRGRLTSATLGELLAMDKALVDPPEPVRIALPAIDLVKTNELAGAFTYFRFPTVGLKPFQPAARPEILRQTIRVRLQPAPSAEAVPLKGPFLYFIHDPARDTMPVVGIVPSPAQ